MIEERRQPTVQQSGESTSNGRNNPQIAKPFCIDKWEVVKAWNRVQKNNGAAGVDNQTLGLFEANLKDNLYTVWNRMSSGSYFPEPVRRVEIPKGDGSKRPLGIPTVRDRIAQEVVRARLEWKLEDCFHADSYGFRPGRSAIDAIDICRKRCFTYGWVIDVDIEKFFDTIDHEKMMDAVRFHCKSKDEKWMVMYIERWLKAGVYHDDKVHKTEKGTPQGGVISPLLANLYLHYAFDLWMDRTYPRNPFERYADDLVIHCKSAEDARIIKDALEERMSSVGLKLHPVKTRIVRCPVGAKGIKEEDVSFTFLGYTFKPRTALNKKTGKVFWSFLPAVGKKAKKKLRNNLKERKVLKNTTLDVWDLARTLNPVVRGWLNYFTKFYPSAAAHVGYKLDLCLVKWSMKKYRTGYKQASAMFQRISAKNRRYFAHWEFFGFQG